MRSSSRSASTTERATVSLTTSSPELAVVSTRRVQSILPRFTRSSSFAPDLGFERTKVLGHPDEHFRIAMVDRPDLPQYSASRVRVQRLPCKRGHTREHDGFPCSTPAILTVRDRRSNPACVSDDRGYNPARPCNRILIASMTDRPSGRAPDEMRTVRFSRHYTMHAEGSVLVEFGDTKVHLHRDAWRSACHRGSLKGQSGQGWVTAEYGMLPRATNGDRMRPGGGPVAGRAGAPSRFQRLIGRSPAGRRGSREALGECSITAGLRRDPGRTAAPAPHRHHRQLRGAGGCRWGSTSRRSGGTASIPHSRRRWRRCRWGSTSGHPVLDSRLSPRTRRPRRIMNVVMNDNARSLHRDPGHRRGPRLPPATSSNRDAGPLRRRASSICSRCRNECSEKRATCEARGLTRVPGATWCWRVAITGKLRELARDARAPGTRRAPATAVGASACPTNDRGDGTDASSRTPSSRPATRRRRSRASPRIADDLRHHAVDALGRPRPGSTRPATRVDDASDAG